MDRIPAPLAPFEHYMLADDRLNYPMTFWVRLKFGGSLEVNRFRAALEAALEWNWRLRATVRGSPSGRTSQLSWFFTSQPASFSTSNTIAPQAVRAALHLGKEAGLRTWVQIGEDHFYLLMQFHHSCCDALGALAFIESVLAIYHTLLKGRLNSSLADSRWIGRRNQARRRWLHTARRIPRILASSASYFWKQPVSIASSGNDSKSCVAFPFASRFLTVDQLGRLMEQSRAVGVTLNDLLLRDLFLTLDRWNRRQGVVGTIRVAMPMNMRLASPIRPSARNEMSMVFIDRAVPLVPNTYDLLKSLAQETRELKDWCMGEVLLQVLRLCGKAPRGIERLVPTKRCLSTAVLSNAGVVFPVRPHDEEDYARVERLGMESVEFFPPIRPLVRAAIGIVTFGRRLAVCLHYDPFVFTQQAGEQLLSEYVRQVIE